MAKSKQDHFNKQPRMDAGDLAVHVAEFTRHLSGLGHTRRTTNGYGGSARHFAQWLSRAKIAVTDINDAGIDRFREHRCWCSGTRRTNMTESETATESTRRISSLSRII